MTPITLGTDVSSQTCVTIHLHDINKGYKLHVNGGQVFTGHMKALLHEKVSDFGIGNRCCKAMRSEWWFCWLDLWESRFWGYIFSPWIVGFFFLKKSFSPSISVSMTNLPEATVCVVGKTWTIRLESWVPSHKWKHRGHLNSQSQSVCVASFQHILPPEYGENIPTRWKDSKQTRRGKGSLRSSRSGWGLPETAEEVKAYSCLFWLEM